MSNKNKTNSETINNLYYLKINNQYRKQTDWDIYRES